MATLYTRLIHTHDIEANWIKCPTFIPKLGELIVYDVDDTHKIARFKIGDGVTSVVDLPFTVDNVIESIFNIVDGTIYADAGRITEYADNTQNTL